MGPTDLVRLPRKPLHEPRLTFQSLTTTKRLSTPSSCPFGSAPKSTLSPAEGKGKDMLLVASACLR